MATKKKPTEDELVPKKTPDSKPSDPTAKPSAVVEVDWGKGFIEHKNAVVTADTIQVPIPFNARRALGGSTKGRYAHVRVKLNAEEIRIGDRVFHKAPSETDPTLTFEVLAKEKPN